MNTSSHFGSRGSSRDGQCERRRMGGKGGEGKRGKEKSGSEREEGHEGKGGAEGRLTNMGASSTSFRVLCGAEFFEAELSDALRDRLKSTYFAAALEESPSASMTTFFLTLTSILIVILTSGIFWLTSGKL